MNLDRPRGIPPVIKQVKGPGAESQQSESDLNDDFEKFDRAQAQWDPQEAIDNIHAAKSEEAATQQRARNAARMGAIPLPGTEGPRPVRKAPDNIDMTPANAAERRAMEQARFANVEQLRKGESIMENAERTVREEIAKAEGRLGAFGEEIGSRQLSLWERMRVVAKAGGLALVEGTDFVGGVIKGLPNILTSRMADDARDVLRTFDGKGPLARSIERDTIRSEKEKLATIREKKSVLALGREVAEEQGLVLEALREEDLLALGRERSREIEQAKVDQVVENITESVGTTQEESTFKLTELSLFPSIARAVATAYKTWKESGPGAFRRFIKDASEIPERMFRQLSGENEALKNQTPEIQGVWADHNGTSAELAALAAEFTDENIKKTLEAEAALKNAVNTARVEAITPVMIETYSGTIEEIKDGIDALRQVERAKELSESTEKGAKEVIEYLNRIVTKNLLSAEDGKKLERLRVQMQEALDEDDSLGLGDIIERLQGAVKTVKMSLNTPAQAVMNLLGKMLKDTMKSLQSEQDPNIGTEIKNVIDTQDPLSSGEYDQPKHIRNLEAGTFEKMENGSREVMEYLNKIEDKNLMSAQDGKKLEEIRRTIQEALIDDDSALLIKTLEELQKTTKTMKGPLSTPAQAVMNYLGKMVSRTLEDAKKYQAEKEAGTEKKETEFDAGLVMDFRSIVMNTRELAKRVSKGGSELLRCLEDMKKARNAESVEALTLALEDLRDTNDTNDDKQYLIDDIKQSIHYALEKVSTMTPKGWRSMERGMASGERPEDKKLQPSSF